MKTLSLCSIALVLFCLSPASLLADTGTEITAWDSPAGIRRLAESNFKSDFFQLANKYQSQPNRIACGPTTGAIVLNALRLDNKDPRLPYMAPHKEDTAFMSPQMDAGVRMYSPDNFLGAQTDAIKTRAQIFGKPLDGAADFGLQLRQLHRMFLAHGAQSSIYVVDDTLPIAEMRRQMLKNLETDGDFVVVNYSRKLLGQSGGGHISPLGAYHRDTDSFLIMDVTPYKHSWIWVPAAMLYSAMKSHDTIENRGFLLIEDSPATADPHSSPP